MIWSHVDTAPPQEERCVMALKTVTEPVNRYVLCSLSWPLCGNVRQATHYRLNQDFIMFISHDHLLFRFKVH